MMSAGRSGSGFTNSGKAGIAELGNCQNVVFKLGGHGMLMGMLPARIISATPIAPIWVATN
jgi:hypothetical protein